MSYTSVMRHMNKTAYRSLFGLRVKESKMLGRDMRTAGAGAECSHLGMTSTKQTDQTGNGVWTIKVHP